MLWVFAILIILAMFLSPLVSILVSIAAGIIYLFFKIRGL